MAHTITLSRRETFRYVGKHRDLDRWKPVGIAKVLPARQVRAPEPENFDDGGRFLLRATIPAGQEPKASAIALRDLYTSQGCSHEWDCCGCRSTYATVRRLSRREFAVFVDVSFNY
jgi:hypothetical protein